MIRVLNTRFSEQKTGSPYALIIRNPTGLILEKMLFTNTSVIVGVQFYILLLKLYRICKQADLWSSLLSSLLHMDTNITLTMKHERR